MNNSVLGSQKIIAVDYAQILLKYLDTLEHDSRKVLDASAISSELLENKQGFLSVDQYNALLVNAQKLLQDPVLGLRLGQLQHVAAHGPLGYAIMSSKNLDAAMHQVCRFIRVRNNLTTLSYSHECHQTVIAMEVDLQQGELYQFIVEQSFASLMNIIRGFVGHNKFAINTRFRYPEPENSAVYDELFNAKPEFCACVNEVRIDTQLLKGFELVDDAVFANMAEKQCEEILNKLTSTDDLLPRVYAIVGKNLGSFPSQKEVARQLNLSSRSLVRQLARMETSFSEILKTTKYELAKYHLLHTQWAIEEIAYLLDYEAPANFSRSFKKWTGLSPRDYRQKYQK